MTWLILDLRNEIEVSRDGVDAGSLSQIPHFARMIFTSRYEMIAKNMYFVKLANSLLY